MVATLGPRQRMAIHARRGERAKTFVKNSLVTPRGSSGWDGCWSGPSLTDEYDRDGPGKFIDAYVSTMW